jgi:hypothetical protein
MLRIADAVDRARSDRETAEVARSVADARRDHDRERLALLHDTAAATLLMVGQAAPVSRQRLAAQARRDLDLLESRPWGLSALPVNIVAALRAETAHLGTAVHFSGADIWLRGPLAAAVVAATREVTNNVDRHAHATAIHIDVRPDRVTIRDDGVGFDPQTAAAGHGIRASIVARMSRVGGTGSVSSAPAHGTEAVLSWPDPRALSPVQVATDADRTIRRVRVTFALALTAYGIVALATAFPPLGAFSQHSDIQLLLGGLTGLCALTAVPAIVFGERRRGGAGATQRP